jgi:membrane-associated protease RseP (regulator of RpoE activity)
MSFLLYDLILLIIFIIFLSSFLYLKRKNLRKEGLLFLYKTKWGINLINKIGTKYSGILKVLSYFSVTLGYFLMAGMIYLFGKIVLIYAFNSEIVQAVKIPPIVPLVPYLPEIFKIDFLPPFYFIYWIIILAIIAITHEFSHGIFSVYNKVKIKTTGFGFFPYFLPIFLAAFVELDEKKMAKKKKFEQLTILSAGTFANVITAILFFLILWGFFSAAFTPAGVVYDSYSYSIVSTASISMVNNIILSNPDSEKIISLINENGPNEIIADNMTYAGVKEFSKDNQLAALYDDAPAINAKLDAIILEINGKKVNEFESFRSEIAKYSPGDTIIITTKGEQVEEREIVLGTNPLNESLPYLGIAFMEGSPASFTGKIMSEFSSFAKPHVYYEPKFGEFSSFVYHLLWWLILISLSVALVNMLPMGIFDGGRFFYLTVLAITKSEKIAKRAFSFVSALLLLLVLAVIILWVFQTFF